MPVYLQTHMVVFKFNFRSGGVFKKPECPRGPKNPAVALNSGGATYLKKGFFKSRRLLDFDPV